MFNHLISVSFLGIVLIPICILFLIFIQSIGEDMRKMTTETQQQRRYDEETATVRKEYTQRLRRIK